MTAAATIEEQEPGASQQLPSSFAFSSSGANARFVQPMLCTLIAKPFDDPELLFEPKFDASVFLGRYDGRNRGIAQPLRSQ